MHIQLQRLNGEQVSVEITASTHTIGGRRLAIFSVRERTEVVQTSPGYSMRTTSSAGIMASSSPTARST